MRCAGLLLLLALAVTEAGAQDLPAPAPGDSVVVRPIGRRYAAGWLRRLFLGREYRSLWAAPVTIPVLDLARFGGGLTPVSRGGGQQTTSLRLRAADGREFYFRSVDKDPSPNLPPELRGTVVAAVVQDQISSAHPTAPLVVGPLLAAAGVLHGEPALYILPDDPRLGEHRSLAGLIGMLEPRIGTGWGGATEVIQGDELFARVEKSPDDRVDARAFLKARLVDLLVGDWDRHRDQWSWARFGDALPHRWQPVPRDRDFAMIRYDGLFLHLGRVRLPQLIDFGPEYPDVLGLTWNGRELDRAFLPELERPAWDSVVAEVQAAITDAVIEEAVRRMPPEHVALNGAALAAALRRRRDALPAVAARFYHMLLEQADLSATDGDDIAVLRPAGADTVEVTLARSGQSSYFRRRFGSADSRELRLFLRGGADSVRLEDGARLPFRVRVIGGAGADVLLAPGARRFRGYDSDPGTVVSPGTSLDARPFSPPPKRTPTEIPPRDWGHRWEPAGLISVGPDVGALIGVGRTLTTYGFRRLPFASRHRFRAGLATGPWTYRADYRGEFRRETSPGWLAVSARASGIDVLRFHGFGNEVPAPRSAEFYRVTQHALGAGVALVRPLGAHVELTGGAGARYVVTDERADRFLTTLDPYGDGRFGVVGAHAGLALDSRTLPSPAQDGIHLNFGGSLTPGWWDATEAYGEVHGDVAGVVNLPGPLAPALHLRAGARKLWGRFPYFDAAFLGDPATVRLGRENRFAGDAAVWGGSELYLGFGRLFVGAPAEFGVLGLAEAGRVYLDGESPGPWHGAVGGGLWLAILDRGNLVSLSVARSEERTAAYFRAGLGF